MYDIMELDQFCNTTIKKSLLYDNNIKPLAIKFVHKLMKEIKPWSISSS